MSSTLTILATLQNFKGLADGTIRITFDSNELSPDEVGKIHAMRLKFGWLVFTGSESIPDTKDLPSSVPQLHVKPGQLQRSKSQRQRAIIELIRQAKGSEFGEEEYYDMRMDSLFNWFQNELEELKNK